MGLIHSVGTFFDAGFVMLVLYLAYNQMFGGKGEAEAESHKSDEVRELQKALKELIGEAEIAGKALNRSLGKRKQELEHLLTELAVNEAKLTAEVNQCKQSNAVEEAELPNETWLGKRSPKTSVSSDKVPDTYGAQIEVSRAQEINVQADSSEFKDRGFAQVVSQAKLKSKAATSEARNNHLESGPEAIFPGFDESAIVDSATYNIAMRLLAQGKEIHVVARKLELPVSEIRHLDSILRKHAALQGGPAVEDGTPVEESSDIKLNYALEGAMEPSMDRSGSDVFIRESQIL